MKVIIFGTDGNARGAYQNYKDTFEIIGFSDFDTSDAESIQKNYQIKKQSKVLN